MKTISLALSTLIFTLHVSIQAATSHWDQLKNKSLAEGVPTETHAGTYKTLTHLISLEPADSHHVDYFSAVGGEYEGVFEANYFDAVSETWIRQSDGGWHIDQWLYRLDHEGNFKYISHYQLQKSPEGFIIAHDAIPFTEVEGKFSFENFLKRWFNLHK